MMQNALPSQTLTWHLLDSEAVLDCLQTNIAGLTSVEVERRKVGCDSNETLAGGEKSGNLKSLFVPWKRALAPIILFLFVGTIPLVFLNGIENAIPIIVIVGLNLSIVIFQVYQTEKSRTALVTRVYSMKDYLPLVEVRRNGDIQHILVQDIVPGDILFLRPGDAVLADGRLHESINLCVCEASLTGESFPVDKTCHILNFTENLPGVYRNMVYKGTKVVHGYGTAVVVATGKDTYIDQIMHSSETINSAA